LRFLPDDLEVQAGEGETILEIAARTGIVLRGACGGDGTCGRCLVLLKNGAVRDRDGDVIAEPGTALRACRSYPVGDPVIEIPQTSRLAEHQVLTGEGEDGLLGAGASDTGAAGDPLLARVRLSLTPPEPGGIPDDWGRLQAALAGRTGQPVNADLVVLCDLPAVLRAEAGTVTVDLGLEGGPGAKVVTVRAGHTAAPAYGVAIDLGTTTVVVELVEFEQGRTVGTLGMYNRQAAYGDDVISRIIYAAERPGGRRQLQEAVLDTVNSLIGELGRRHGISPEEIRVAVCAGNPTMTHLFLGVDPAFIRLEPYTPAANFWPLCRAGELGLFLHPRAPVHVLPGVASYLGGDITGGVTVSGFGAGGEVTLFVDIGTNGEMVLGDGDWLVGFFASSLAAAPTSHSPSAVNLRSAMSLPGTALPCGPVATSPFIAILRGAGR
jgi:uncharacterized 2Fe-2S/4Fe-4S cluster protein (DUF4445 family)